MAKRLIDSADLIAKLPIVEEDKQISLIGAVADVVTMISECKPDIFWKTYEEVSQ